MTDRQFNTTSMWGAEASVLARYESTWQSRRAFTNAVDKLRDARRQITEPAMVLGTNTTGIRVDKDTLELAAAQKADLIGNVLQAYAYDTGNNELYREMMFSVSDLKHMRSEESYNKMKEVLEKARLLQTELEHYGIEPNELAAMDEAMEAYHQKLTAPREAIVKKSSAVKSIATIIKDGNAALHIMDMLINTFATANADFVREYKSARIIVDLHGHKGNNATPPQV